MTNLLQNRTYLHERHRLSHQQIDRWLGEKREKEFLPEKLKQLETVNKFLMVTDLLTKNDISYICFKGALLSFRIYNDPTVRISSDIDLLVEKKMIAPIVAVLTKSGFHLSKEMIWPQKKIQRELLFNAMHDLSFYNSELNVRVEIHWVLMHELPVAQKKIQQMIAENLTEIEFAGRIFTVFSYEFELLYLLLHGAKHGWFRLKWLVDIHDYPVSKLDKQKFEKIVTQLQAWRIIGQANNLLNHFFNTSMPFSRKKRTPAYFIRYPFRDIGSDRTGKTSTHELFDQLRYLWFLFPGICYKCRLVSGTLFRPGDLMEINSSFRIVYYLYRPYSFIRRRVLHV